MIVAFLSVLTLQASLILFDEFYFHRRRFVPRWERWGHPIDTFFFLVPLLILTFSKDPSAGNYIFWSVFSCLLVTKDEWVHQKFCRATENWLHAVLFLLHPVVFFLAWEVRQASLLGWMIIPPSLFFIYQFYYWNFYAQRAVSTR